MVLGVKIHYRADKARIFNLYQEDLPQYLAGFLGEDLRKFKLPMPDDCILKAWRSGWVVCRWYTEYGEVRQSFVGGAMNDHYLYGVVASVPGHCGDLQAPHHDSPDLVCGLVHVKRNTRTPHSST